MLIHGLEIVPLFDGPHMFECIRNNMLTKLLEFDVNNAKKIRLFANWHHIHLAYTIDTGNMTRDRRLPNLTENHFSADSRKKMKVKYMAQALSTSVGKEIKNLVKKGVTYFVDIRFFSHFKIINYFPIKEL